MDKTSMQMAAPILSDVWAPGAELAGALDGVFPAVGIRGWVVALDSSDASLLEVQAKCGANILARAVTTGPRSDISAMLGRTVNCGFQLLWTDFDYLALSHAPPDTPIWLMVRGCELGNSQLTASAVLRFIGNPGEPLDGDEVAALLNSPLFDDKLYAMQAGLGPDRVQAVEHYLRSGEAAGIVALPGFDAALYRRLSPDLPAGANLLAHYVSHGRAEGRYIDMNDLVSDAAQVEAAGLFDSSLFYLQQQAELAPGLPPLQQHLAFGWRLGGVANSGFDDAFYAETYTDAAGRPPLVHFAKVGRHEFRITRRADYDAAYAVLRPHFDATYYRRNSLSLGADEDPLRHYLIEGVRLGLNPDPSFSVSFYLEQYPDIYQGRLEPYSHFIIHGRNEGRLGRPNLADWLLEGDTPYDPDLPTLVIVTHEASRTGAPLVGLELGRQLAATNNVIHITGRPGVLLRDLAAASPIYGVGQPDHPTCVAVLQELRRRWKASAIILNSVETVEWAEAALDAGLASVALIHEFAEYSKPLGKIARMVAITDRVISPAELLRTSAQQEVLEHYHAMANNVVVQPQGRLKELPRDPAAKDLTEADLLDYLGIKPGGKIRVILGAGFVQIRKGVDLFMQTAAEVRRRFGPDVRFLWVGDGYQPATDTSYSVWLQSAFAQLELEGTFFFLPAQSNLDAVFAICDLFYLPSRLDPFPNVAVDALACGRPLVCFDKATGLAEYIQDDRIVGAVVPFGDVSQAAEAIWAALGQLEAAKANADFVARSLDFASYTRFVMDEVVLAKRSAETIEANCRRIAEAGVFDAHYNLGGAPAYNAAARALKRYVASGSKGLAKTNPRPGFNEGLYRAQAGVPASAPGPSLSLALDLDRDGGALPVTHPCHVLVPQRRRTPTLRIALHLHLYYADLAPEFVQRIKTMRRPIDVFVTTDTVRKAASIERHFGDQLDGELTLIQVPNRGRDIGPLLTSLAEPLINGGYDLVGHLHGKKSLAMGVEGGDRWRRFLVDTLFYDKPTFDQILGLFADDDRLGLVFAEDRHAVGWSKNYSTALGLAARLRPEPRLVGFPCFPIGNMFWARPEALRSLFAAGLDTSDYPGEPTNADGTLLHAIERMLPGIVESLGFTWCTVMRRGVSW